jgi:hypothetical protein
MLAAALYAVVFQFTLPSRLAKDEDYRQVVQVLSQEARPKDVVFLFPWWTERARLFIPEGLPVVGYLHSESDALYEHPRVWVLSQPRLPKNDVSGFEKAFLPGRRQEGAPRAFGGLMLTLYTNGRARPVLFSAVQQVARAEVYLEQPDGARESCPFNGAAHVCPGGAHVAAEWHELFYEPRFCLAMQPPGGGTRLIAQFRDVPASAELLLEGGVNWEHALARDTTPLNLGAEDADTRAPLLNIQVPLAKEGMQKAALAPAPAVKSLRLWTQADNAKDRDACLELRAFGQEPGS